jgi:hypothetical protein
VQSARALRSEQGGKPSADSNEKNLEFRRTAYTRLVELSSAHGDWINALSLIAQLTPEECQNALMLFSNWPQEDRAIAQRLILRRWASVDPAGALSSTPDFPYSKFYTVLLKDAAHELAAQDPKGALEILSGSGLSRRKLIIASAILDEIAAVDPQSAAQFLIAHPIPVDRDTCGSIAAGLARDNVQAALEWAGSLRGTDREAALQNAWETWAGKDPAGAALALGETDKASRPKGDNVKAAIARAWSQIDPSAAAAWIQGLPGERGRIWNAFSPNVQQLGASGCSKLLASIDAGPAEADLASRMAREMAGTDPRQAVDWAASLPRDGRGPALGSAVSLWVQKDPEAALAWMQALSVGADRDTAARGSAQILAQIDPTEAAKWVPLIQNPTEQTVATSEVVSQWIRVDREAAAAWVAQLPDGAAQVAATGEVARSWAFQNPAATEQWIGTLPAGAARDSAIIGFVQTMDGYDPGLATRWAASLDEPRQRAEYVIGTFRRWMNEGDSNAARQWLQTATLDADVRSKLVRYIAASPGRAE